MPVKYVFVTGGVVSGLGKGITAASLGRLLKARGYKVTMQKFDPYINIDDAPQTLRPTGANPHRCPHPAGADGLPEPHHAVWFREFLPAMSGMRHRRRDYSPPSL